MAEVPFNLGKTYRYVHVPHERLQPDLKLIDVGKKGFVMRIVGEKDVIPQGPFLGKRATLKQNEAHLAEIAMENGLPKEKVASASGHKMFFPTNAGNTKIGNFGSKKAQLYYRPLTPEERRRIRGKASG